MIKNANICRGRGREEKKTRLTSVVDIVNNVEVVFHRGAVCPAEAGGQEEQQHHGCRQPAARQDAEPHISRSPGQHAGASLRGTQRDAVQLSTIHSPIRSVEEGWSRN